MEGCKALGHDVKFGQPTDPMGPGDFAIVWNKTSRSRQSFEMARAGGGAVIVAENGYYGKDPDGSQNFAMALDGHNGSGRWFVPPYEFARVERDIPDIQPYVRKDGLRKIVIAGQRGIGSRQMASPYRHQDHIASFLENNGWATLIREHPGRHKPTVPLYLDLKNAHALVVWSSNCATEALIRGVPVFYCAPAIVTAGASQRFDLEDIHYPEYNEEARLWSFHRMLWAQWPLAAIRSGVAIDTLLRVHRGELEACQEGLGL